MKHVSSLKSAIAALGTGSAESKQLLKFMDVATESLSDSHFYSTVDTNCSMESILGGKVGGASSMKVIDGTIVDQQGSSAELAKVAYDLAGKFFEEGNVVATENQKQALAEEIAIIMTNSSDAIGKAHAADQHGNVATEAFAVRSEEGVADVRIPVAMAGVIAVRSAFQRAVHNNVADSAVIKRQVANSYVLPTSDFAVNQPTDIAAGNSMTATLKDPAKLTRFDSALKFLEANDPGTSIWSEALSALAVSTPLNLFDLSADSGDIRNASADVTDEISSGATIKGLILQVTDPDGANPDIVETIQVNLAAGRRPKFVTAETDSSAIYNQTIDSRQVVSLRDGMTLTGGGASVILGNAALAGDSVVATVRLNGSLNRQTGDMNVSATVEKTELLVTATGAAETESANTTYFGTLTVEVIAFVLEAHRSVRNLSQYVATVGSANVNFQYIVPAAKALRITHEPGNTDDAQLQNLVQMVESLVPAIIDREAITDVTNTVTELNADKADVNAVKHAAKRYPGGSEITPAAIVKSIDLYNGGNAIVFQNEFQHVQAIAQRLQDIMYGTAIALIDESGRHVAAGTGGKSEVVVVCHETLFNTLFSYNPEGSQAHNETQGVVTVTATGSRGNVMMRIVPSVDESVRGKLIGMVTNQNASGDKTDFGTMHRLPPAVVKGFPVSNGTTGAAGRVTDVSFRAGLEVTAPVGFVLNITGLNAQLGGVGDFDAA